MSRVASSSDAHLLGLQRSAGNAAVVALAKAQRAPAGPAPPVRVGPEQDPRFQQVIGTTRQLARAERRHPPAHAKAVEAQRAAVPPPGERVSRAAAAQVGTMAAQRPGDFDKAAFIAAVRNAIAARAPRNLEEADEFASSGRAGEVRGEVSGLVKQGNDASAQGIRSATAAAPDEGRTTVEPPTPMRETAAGAPPPPVGGSQAMPAPRPAAQTDLAAAPVDIRSRMAEARVTDEQLANANEPQFADALAAKQQVETHSRTAPERVRAEERGVLERASAGAAAADRAAVTTMRGARAARLGRVNAGMSATRARTEARRAEVAVRLRAIYEATRTEVMAILEGIDGKVAGRFERGEAGARAAFEAQIASEMAQFKEARYSGVDGAARWAWDKLTSPPPEVDEIFQRGRATYVERMEIVIGDVADLVATELSRAKVRIASGRAQVVEYVQSLPRDLQRSGAEAAAAIQGQFDSLSSDVDAKQQGLVDDLAQRYTAATAAVDERISEMQAQNRGLLDRAKDAIGGTIQTILGLKDLLLGVLARAAGAIERIIADPIAFLGRLIDGIKSGLLSFVANIGTHLQQGLLGWLTGALGRAGITMPERLDLKGIVGLILTIVGLTWASMRRRIATAVGEPFMARVEQGIEIVRLLATEGPAALWRSIVEKVGDLYDTVIGGIKDFVITRVITAGITWLISLLNPAAAFIKACRAIHDIVMFFVQRGSQIVELVNAILDSITQIASGAVGAAATYIERTLARALPVAISFFASLLGLGGIGEKVREIIGRVQAPIHRVLDGIIAGVVRRARALWSSVRVPSSTNRRAGETTTAAATERSLPPEARGRLYAEVTAMVGDRSQTVTTPDEAERLASTTLMRFTSRGLKAVSLRQKPGQLGLFDVYADASPEQRVGTVKAEQRISLAHLTSRYTTTLIAHFNGAPFGTHRSVGESAGDHQGHAETWLLTYLTGGIVSMYRPGERNQLDVRITRSPCPVCRERIAKRLLQLREQGKYIHVNIQTASIHRGHTMAGVDAFVSVALLDDEGISLSAWDILSDLDKLGIVADDQEALRSDSKAVATLQRRVDQVQRVLDAIAAVRALK